MSASAAGSSKLWKRVFCVCVCVSGAVCKRGCVWREKSSQVRNSVFNQVAHLSLVIFIFLCLHGQRRGRDCLVASVRVWVWHFFITNLTPYFRKNAWPRVTVQRSFCANFIVSVWTCPSTTPTTTAEVHTTVLALQRSHPPEKGSQSCSCAGVLGVCRGGFHMCCLLLSTRW